MNRRQIYQKTKKQLREAIYQFPDFEKPDHGWADYEKALTNFLKAEEDFMKKVIKLKEIRSDGGRGIILGYKCPKCGEEFNEDIGKCPKHD